MRNEIRRQFRIRGHSSFPIPHSPFACVAIALLSSAPLNAQLPIRLSPAEFGTLSARLSEPSGYFDTDNLVSNEDSYLHALTMLRELNVRGGAYLGVGPDQNFSYVAAIRPRIAFILDIRRDNLLEHLLFKSIFAIARDRLEYLCLLFGKQRDPGDWTERPLAELLDYIQRAPVDSATVAASRARVQRQAPTLGITLSPADLETIDRFHRAFIAAGLDLRLQTFNRAERFDYPSYQDLLLETDLEGRSGSFLADESRFRFLKALSERNLMIPVVGDFAGPTALRAIGAYLRERREQVSVFYTSNVEQYLLRDGSFERFAQNVGALPRRPGGVIIRSYFPYQFDHPQRVQGYLSVQLVQPFEDFLRSSEQGSYRSYRDLVGKGFLVPEAVR